MRKPSQLEQRLEATLKGCQSAIKEQSAEISRLREENANILADNDSKAHAISQFMSDLATMKSQLHDSKTAYSFRHNQALAAAQEITDLKSALAQEKFQYKAFKSEVSRMLVLQAFPGGLRDKTMITRCRNRLANELTPQPHRASTQGLVDQAAETHPTDETIENLGK